jgi:acetyl-CoA synthetase (ADP-forming)
MFGLGSIFTEIYRDVTFRIAPVSPDDAQEMLKEIKAYPLIAGYRGKSHVDEHALIGILVNVSKLVMDYSQIVQLGLNPVIAYETGASAVDARIILTPSKISGTV